MARTRAQQQVFIDLQERYGQEVAQAFFRALDDLRNAARVQQIMAAYAAGDVEAALEAVDIDPAAFNEMLDKIRESYQAGGKAGADVLPKRGPDGTAMSVRFDGRNPDAERWLQSHSSTLIRRITDDQRAAVRTSLRENMERGVNPRTAALDVVGRINRATGKREGGILGLTQVQESYVRSAKDELASGDPASLRHYLTRTRRDKRFDKAVRAAIEVEKPVPAETLAKAITAYERRLLKLRGDTIGRTEALTSLNAAAYEALRQAVASGKIPETSVRRVWRSAGDLRVRHTHMGLNADTVGLNEAFRSPSGAMLRYPGDTLLGAPASEVIGCRCIVEARIDFLANIR
ncbi:hypothetical protein [Brevundimonas sp. Root1279]|uniref:hypothetical protein n=1 Tax=Brevundimonas sp. Root1279 TaxID=1736443 RepID=UPI0007011D12|nr:hypothetical protein [Brevundimonas sp. Root1279]KQW79718.1 hypothetical protein ASC65_14310 [Brevundimonas sp. Root1279]